MKKIESYLPQRLTCSAAKYAIFSSIAALALGCSKTGSSGSPGTGGGGGGNLLTKEIVLIFTASGTQLDSIINTYQYNGNKNLSQVQQVSTAQSSSATAVINLDYNFTYAGNTLSNVSGTYMENLKSASANVNATTQINMSFQSSGSKTVSYVQTVQTTGSPITPLSPETANDSVLFTYDASGNLSNLLIYEIAPRTKRYSLFVNESFSFTGGNLTQTVERIYEYGFLADSVTSTYSYNSKISATPAYIFPGVSIVNVNDLTQVDAVTAGLLPSSSTTTYQTTYNSSNQPVSSVVTISKIPASAPNDATTEKISYFY